jgi:copper chaperone CopZ
MKSDHKPYTVRFDDQFYNHSNKASHQKLGEDHGSHGKKGGGGGGQPQGILKTSKNKHGDDGYSSDEENRGNQKNKGGNNNQQHGNSGNNKQGKQLGRSQSMDFRVNLCCDNCERKVKKALRKLDVDQVLCDQYNNKVMVTGNAKPESILKKLKSVKRDTLMWHSHK